MRILYENKLKNANNTIPTEEKYVIIELDDGRKVHRVVKEDIYGNTNVHTILIQSKLSKSINAKCHLCDNDAYERISIGNIYENYCKKHGTEVLKNLIVYKVASQYWNELYKATVNEKTKS